MKRMCCLVFGALGKEEEALERKRQACCWTGWGAHYFNSGGGEGGGGGADSRLVLTSPAQWFMGCSNCWSPGPYYSKLGPLEKLPL